MGATEASTTILLVEDNRVEAEATRAFLEGCGYRVVWVDEGGRAIKVARSDPIDCVLLDLVLPDMNGNEVCRWLKANEDTRGIPLIMLTAKRSMEDKVSGLQLGADDYLAKPYDQVELNARIYAALRTKKLQDALRARNRELETALGRMEHMAVTDPLTGLYNRRKFEQIMEAEFSRIRRYRSPLSCLMIDIDHFKHVNDDFGHRAGDRVLADMAEVIRANIREVDTPARWGGEEFVVLLPETDAAGAVPPARRIKAATAERAFVELPGCRISVSIGMATAPARAIDTGEALIDASDQAMYRAKRKGRDRIEAEPADAPPPGPPAEPPAGSGPANRG